MSFIKQGRKARHFHIKGNSQTSAFFKYFAKFTEKHLQRSPF